MSKEDQSRRGITRRDFHRLSGSLALAAAAAPLALRRAWAEGGGELVTELPEHEVMVTSLQYVNESAKPDQKCSGCVLYTSDDADNGRGKCQLFQSGLVADGGWCLSWAKKP